MTLQEPLEGAEAKSPNQILHRLERNNRELLHLKSTLRSYRCEPKTPGLFERFEDLKDTIEGMYKHNLEIIQLLRESRRTKEDQLRNYRTRLKEFHVLQQRVLEYIGMAKLHG